MVNIKKKDIYTVTITDYTDEGLGVGKVNLPGTESFFPLFIKNTAIGDVLEAEVMKLKSGYGYARMVNLVEASPDRKDPGCKVFGKCGGCRLRHIRYDAQLEWKEKRVADVMERVGGVKAGVDFELMPVIGMDDTLRYRNKAQYPVGEKDRKAVTGFYAERTHSVIPVEDCLIEHESNRDILKVIRDYIDKKKIPVYDETRGEGVIRHVLIRTAFARDEIMVCLVVNAGKEIIGKLGELADILKDNKSIRSFMVNYNTRNTNVILGDREDVIYGESYITDSIGDLQFRISAGSFFQVNPAQTIRLYEKALEYCELQGDENVWDLYCGIGTISLFLAQKAGSVLGVEVFEKAVENARENAALNAVSNVSFICAKAEDVVLDSGIERPDVVVVDPPRKGCDGKLLETIAESGAKRLVYVSCNPATLARDTAVLRELGLSLLKLQPVDMFPETTGVENVALFMRT